MIKETMVDQAARYCEIFCRGIPSYHHDDFGISHQMTLNSMEDAARLFVICYPEEAKKILEDIDSAVLDAISKVEYHSFIRGRSSDDDKVRAKILRKDSMFDF